MGQLISIRTNIHYTKKVKEDQSEPDVFERQQELIFLVDKAEYKRTNSSEIIRERSIEDFRFTVSDESFEIMMKMLQQIKDAKEEDLH